MNSLFRLLFLVSISSAVCYNAPMQIKQNPTVYPYGGEKVTIRGNIFQLIFKKHVDFTKAQFTSSINFSRTRFDNSVKFNKAKFDTDVDFFQANFDKSADFLEVQFTGSANFHGSQFHARTDFRDSKFISNVVFAQSRFADHAIFVSTLFNGKANYRTTEFFGKAHFVRSRFIDFADFTRAKFDSSAIFLSATFFKSFCLRSATFDKKPNFEGAYLKGIVDLSGTSFFEGVDLRRTTLDSVKIIYYDDHTNYPDGKLFVRWEQIKGRLHLNTSRIDVFDFPSPESVFAEEQNYLKNVSDSAREEIYKQVEIFYYRLRDNYIAQRDNSSADAVMYELGMQRKEILKEWLWKCYGWFFGWGYQPWRFLLLAVLPLMLIFAFIWYWFYYELVMRIIDDKLKNNYESYVDSIPFVLKEINLFTSIKIIPTIRLNVYDHSNTARGVNYLSRYWHVVYFSASVLLGVRFKKDWIQIVPSTGRPGFRSFVKMITFEWLLGIGLYVAFAIYVKGSRFEFIKDLLGF